MRRKSLIFMAAAVILAALHSCSDPEKKPDEVILPSPATLKMLSESVTLTSGGEGYVDFRVSPFETSFNHDVAGGKCDIALQMASGVAADKAMYSITAIEPLGGGENAGKYRAYIKDGMRRHTYSDLCLLVLKDSYGRASKSGTFTIHCECDELTRSTLNLGLPLVKIDTDGGEEPSCEYVTHPPGCNGGGIRNATKVPGSVAVMDGDEIKYFSGSYLKGESGMTVKIRGNTSAYGAKKPFKIKLQKKGDMLFRGNDDKYKDKEWLLLCYDDLKMMSGFKVNELLGLQWTPAFKFVNLIFNGEYRGLYMLTEAVKRNESCRLNVDKSGYVIEYDAYWWNEDVYFTAGWDYSMAYTFKYPDDDEVSAAQIAYIRSYIVKVEAAVRNGTYDKYIDVLSFARWLLGHDILGNLDCAGSNIYMTKYDDSDSSPLKMANMWDFDNIFRMEGTWANVHVWGGAYFYKLLSSSNPVFRQTYVALWDSHSKSICKAAGNHLKSLASSAEGQALDASIVQDNKRWRSAHPTVDASYQTAKTWFDSRAPWLDAAIGGLR